jgi:hypothetical protein
VTGLHPDLKAARGLCAVKDCTSPGVVTVSVSSVRIAFRIDHARIPSWAKWLRCWTCAGAELDRLITTAGAGVQS